MELSSNAEVAADFINRVVPASMQAEAAAKKASADSKPPSITTANYPAVSDIPAVSDVPSPPPAASSEPAWITEGRTPNPEELKNATPEQIRLAFERKEKGNREITPPLA